MDRAKTVPPAISTAQIGKATITIVRTKERDIRHLLGNSSAGWNENAFTCHTLLVDRDPSRLRWGAVLRGAWRNGGVCDVDVQFLRTEDHQVTDDQRRW